MIDAVKDVHQIVCNSPGTDDRLDVSFEDLGLTNETAQAALPVILSKRNSSGTSMSPDESITIDLTNNRLTISEGSTGFSDGDVYVVGICMPRRTVNGTSRAS